MLASINPLGERGRNQRYAVTVTAYVAASAAAAALLGSVLGALGAAIATPALALVVVAVIAVIGLLLDSGVAGAAGTRALGPQRQVNEDWLATYRGWVYGAGFGAQLGVGFSTIVVASATWVAFACALFAGSAVGGLLVGTTFGLARALPVLLTASVTDGESLSRVFRRLDTARPRVARVTTGVQVIAVTALLITGLATFS